mmetsp:Transcript_9796/g.7382  ORF Transcript_9796/g.7382 Transcript_9796/m.7382 type:complete len:89 (+) Transcript_9796:297-563(+)
MKYLSVSASQKIAKDEKKMQCPACNYFEIWSELNDSNFFICKAPSCSRHSCSICFKILIKAEEGYDEEDKEEDYEEVTGSYEQHFLCF